MKSLYYTVASLWLLLLCSCHRSEMDKEKSSSREFTPEEYEALGKRIEKKINARSYDTLMKVFDAEYLVEKINQQVTDPEILKEFKAVQRGQAMQEFKNAFNWGKEIAEAISNKHGKYEFIRVHHKNNVPHLLLRLVSDDGLNYHDYEVRTIDDQLRFTDVYVYGTGEYFSTTLLDIVTRFVKSSSRRVGNPQEQADDFEQKTDLMLSKIEQQDFKDALTVYESLPTVTRKSKAMMTHKLTIASNMGDAFYEKTIREYEKLFPNDPSLVFMNMDLSYIKKEYDRSLVYITQLDTLLGGDSYLDLLRANSYYAKGETKRAMQLIEHYIHAKPKDTQGYWKKFEILGAEQKDAEAIEVLNEIDRKTMYSRRMITYYVETKYPDFAILSCFQTWKDKWIKRYQEKNSWKLKKNP